MQLRRGPWRGDPRSPLIKKTRSGRGHATFSITSARRLERSRRRYVSFLTTARTRRTVPPRDRTAAVEDRLRLRARRGRERVLALAGSSGSKAMPAIALPRALRLRNARFELRAERLAHRLELDPVEHVLEEAAHDQPLGLGRARGRATSGRRAARGRPGRASRRACSARRSRGSRAPGSSPRARRREDQVAVLLVRVRPLGVRLDADHPAPDRASPCRGARP